MSDVEKMMRPPLGSLGGPEYVREEQEASLELLRLRITRAEEALNEALELKDSELKDVKIRMAQENLASTLTDLQKVK